MGTIYDIHIVLAKHVNKDGPEHPILGKHWIWNGYRSPDGYGEVKVCGRSWKAHRYIYTKLVKEVPPYMHLHHKCEVKECVNPDHLEISGFDHCGNHNRNKTHCPNGHEYTLQNTILVESKLGYISRRCRICANDNVKRWKERHNAI